MTNASEMMEKPTAEMVMQRRILSDQYGVMWFGGIMAFKHLGLAVAARHGETCFKWGKENYSLTGNYDMLGRFFEGRREFSADHLIPQRGCARGDIKNYCHLLMTKLADILQLVMQVARTL